MSWDRVVEEVTPHIVKIEAPYGHGTGFLCLYGRGNQITGIATARHVVAHADDWQEPLKIHHLESGKTTLLKEEQRLIFSDPSRDSAVIVIATGQLPLPEDPIELFPRKNRLAVGSAVGWLGYPNVSGDSLCFFAGTVSAFQAYRSAYLIDGVTVHGVSGGPVFCETSPNVPSIVGVVSAYIVNRATGEALPGLATAQDVSHLFDTVAHIQTLQEARARQEEAAATQPPLEEEPPPTATGI